MYSYIIPEGGARRMLADARDLGSAKYPKLMEPAVYLDRDSIPRLANYGGNIFERHALNKAHMHDLPIYIG